MFDVGFRKLTDFPYCYGLYSKMGGDMQIKYEILINQGNLLLSKWMIICILAQFFTAFQILETSYYFLGSTNAHIASK